MSLSGHWLIAKTPILAPYPCRCGERRYSRCSPQYCPCAGRTDLEPIPDGFPESCCALTYNAHVGKPKEPTQGPVS